MITWMTVAENRALEAASNQGFLVCRKEQRTLIEQHLHTCCRLNLPAIRVERQRQQSQVVMQWPNTLPDLTHEQQCKLRGLISEPDQVTGLLPIVFRQGAYSTFVSHENCLELAKLIASWIREQF